MSEIKSKKQTKATGVGRGGPRANAGRPKNKHNIRTEEMTLRAQAEGILPLDYMLAVMRNDTEELSVRLDAAKASAPYLHAKLNAITLKGDSANPLALALGLSDAADLKKLIRGR